MPNNGVGTANTYGVGHQPSPSVFGFVGAGCPGEDLVNDGNGLFLHEDFNRLVTEPGFPNGNTGGTGASFALDTNFNHVLKMSTGTAASVTANAVSVNIYTEPVAATVLRSGSPFWFEADIGVGQITAGNGLFVGLASVGALGAVGPFTKIGTAAFQNTLTTTNSLIGFYTHGDAPTNCDIIYQNATTTSGVVTILANALTSPQATTGDNPGNPDQFTLPLNGTLGFTTGAWATVTSTNVNSQKLGIAYDGDQYCYFFLNGVQLVKFDTTNAFDQTQFYGLLISVATTFPAAAAAFLDIPFVRFGSVTQKATAP